MKDDLLARIRTRADSGMVLLVASSPLSHKLKYVDQVVAAPDADTNVRFHTVGGALTDVDIVHVVGSPDAFLGLDQSSSRLERFKRTRNFVAQLSSDGVALVRTLYGPMPELTDPLEAAAAALLDSATTRFVVVDGATRTPDPARTVVIPLADLTEPFAGYPTRDQIFGRLLCISDEELGAVAEGVLKTFFVNRTPGLSLRLAGVAGEAVLAQLERAVDRTPEKITTRNEVLSDAALIEEITAAEFVLVPEPHTLAGYHLIMLALTFGRPVIAPANEMLLALRDEVGASWVIPLASPITAERLDTAIAQARERSNTARPNLTGRGWMETGRQYAKVFRDAVNETRATIEATAGLDQSSLEVTRVREGDKDINLISLNLKAARGSTLHRRLADTGGRYEPEVFALMLHRLGQADKAMFIDVGSNIGLFSLAAAHLGQHLGSHLDIYAHEPHPSTQEIARALQADNRVSYVLSPVALSDSTGTADFYISARADTSNSLVRNFRPAKDVIQVQVDTLDNTYLSAALAQRYDEVLVMIDVETAEPAVLRGAECFLEAVRPTIICEVLAGRTEAELSRILADVGYSLYRFDGTHWRLEATLRGDETYQHRYWLFVPSERTRELGDRFQVPKPVRVEFRLGLRALAFTSISGRARRAGKNYFQKAGLAPPTRS